MQLTDWLGGIRANLSALLRSASVKKRRGIKLAQPAIEGLEDRALLTFTNTLAAGVVTFTEPANAGDTLVLEDNGAGLLRHNLAGGGYNSFLDFNPAVAGDQLVALNAVSQGANAGSVLLTQLSVTGGNGVDTIQLNALTLAATTQVTLSGGAGNDTVNLANLTLGGAASTLTVTAEVISIAAPGGITTNTNQTYNGPILLDANSILTSTLGDITFEDDVDSRNDTNAGTAAYGLTVRTLDGRTTFRDDVGRGIQANADPDGLNYLITDDTTVFGQLTFDVGVEQVRTVGNQTFYEAVRLQSPSITFSSSDNGDITFNSTLGGTADLRVSTGGDTIFGDTVGPNLSSLTTDGGGTTIIRAATVTTVGDQIYDDDVLLENNVVVESTDGNIDFRGYVDARNNAVAGTSAYGLTTRTPFTPADALRGNTTFRQAVGGNNQANADPDGLNYLITDDVTASGQLFLNADVTTVGNQIYNEDVLIGSDVTVDSLMGDITFEGYVDAQDDGNADTSTYGLTTLTPGGDTTFEQAVGDDNQDNADPDGLQYLRTDVAVANGFLYLNGGLVRTTEDQTYYEAALLGDDTELISTDANFDITFFNTLDGTFRLEVYSDGYTIFGDEAGGNAELESLFTDAGGTTRINGGSVTTNEYQTYNDAVLLGADALLTSLDDFDITFDSTVDGAYRLTVNTGGFTTFEEAVGDIDPLRSLTTDFGGTTRINGGSAETLEYQTYNDAVQLGDDTDLTSDNNDDITFAYTLDGTFRLRVFTDGYTIFDDAVGAVDPLRSLFTDATGTTRINGGSIETLEYHTYDDAVQLGADAILTSLDDFDITFNSTVNGTFDLEVRTEGYTIFNDVVGAVDALLSLTTDIGGTTRINTTLIRTTGNQTYGDDVLLEDNVIVYSIIGSITFEGYVDAQDNATADTSDYGLTTRTPAGDTTFAREVGGNNVGNADADGLQYLRTDDVLASGTLYINGGLVQTVQDQTYYESVRIGSDTELTNSDDDYDITFNNTLDGTFDLEVLTGGDTIFNGTVGVVDPLASLTTDDPGTTRINTATVRTTGNQTYGDDVVLGANATLTSTATGNITFEETLNGPYTLDVNTAGDTIFGGAVGPNLVSLTTDEPGTTRINGGTITTTGFQTYNDDVVLGANTTLVSTANGDITFAETLNGPYTLNVNTGGETIFGGAVGPALVSLTTDEPGTTRINGGTITTTGNQTYNDPVVLGNNASLTSTANGDITFAETLNGAYNLTLAVGTGNIIFTGAVGGGTRLGNVLINSAFNVTANALTVASLTQTAGTGTTTFDSAVDANTATGVAITTNAIAVNDSITTTNNGTVTLSAATTLGIAAAGDIFADGTVDLTGGTGITTAGDVTTTNDNVFYRSNTTLTGPVTINTGAGAGNIEFQGTLNGAFDLTLAAGTGAITFQGDIGGQTPVGDAAGDAITIQSASQVNLGTTPAITMTLNGTLAITGNALTVTGQAGGDEFGEYSTVRLSGGGVDANVIRIAGSNVNLQYLQITAGRNAVPAQNRTIGHGVSVQASNATLTNLHISGNDGDGVEVIGNTVASVTIQNNSIHDNDGIGIDLVQTVPVAYPVPADLVDFSQSYTLANGVSTNDKDFVTNGADSDADTGPNGLQNYPEISFIYIGKNQLNQDELVITYSIPVADPGTYTAQFFLADDAWRSGETFLAEADYEANGTLATARFLVANLPAAVSPSLRIVATATAPDGSTSEFSRAAAIQNTPGLAPSATGNVQASLPQFDKNADVDPFSDTGFLYLPGPTNPVPGEVPDWQFRWATDGGWGQFIAGGVSPAFYNDELGFHAPNSAVDGAPETTIRDHMWGLLETTLTAASTQMNLRLIFAEPTTSAQVQQLLLGQDASRPAGTTSSGMVLLITQEEMRVDQSVVPVVTDVPGSGGREFAVTLTVTRGVNGTTAVAHNLIAVLPPNEPIVDEVTGNVIDLANGFDASQGYIAFVGGTKYLPITQNADDAIAFYLIQNGSYDRWAALNPGNNPQNPADMGENEGLPQAFYSFGDDNPDDRQHLRTQYDPVTGQIKLFWSDQFNLGALPWTVFQGGKDAIISIIDPYVQPAVGIGKPSVGDAVEQRGIDHRQLASHGSNTGIWPSENAVDFTSGAHGGNNNNPASLKKLNVTLGPLTIAEGGATATGIVSRDAGSQNTIIVITLTHDADTTIIVGNVVYGPGENAIITLPANETSVAFTITNITKTTRLVASSVDYPDKARTINLSKKLQKKIDKQLRKQSKGN